MSSKPKITDLTEEQLKAWTAEVGEKPFRAKQLFQWLYLHQAKTLDEMQNIPKSYKNKLENAFTIERAPIINQVSASDGTVKFLQEMQDGSQIESVLMRHGDHNTVCISTQVGCAMGCKFCLTARMGFKRNLTAGEIVDQVLNAQSLLPEGEKVRNIVYMGMGEPFHNYQNTIRSLTILLNPAGLNFSSRRVTVSTCGILEGIEKFAQEPVKANLAISLNGVTQESRAKLMPISRRYSLEKLIEACRNFPMESRQRITFEYILMRDLTDSIESAKALVKLMHGIKSKINLIPYNENPILDFKSPTMEQVKVFQKYLLDHGVIATLRISKGQGISAACGQLATESKQKQKESQGD
jgi:23S rRNA (adenine2503-C2)-methyltransferase